jgi:trehalose 6-phosphate phosphatase
MRDLFAPEHLAILERWVSADPLLAFDYDGTLAPIVADPQRAELRPRTRALLQALPSRYACAVLSGRRLADLARLLDGLDGFQLVGNHGMEWPDGAPDAEQLRLVRAWGDRLDGPLAEMAGVKLEDKGVSLSIHYRLAADPDGALAALRGVVAGLPGARVEEGKRVINLTPDGAPDKHVALERLLARTGRPAAIYVGDDTNDERVFAGADPERVLTIRVGRDDASRARFYLREQAAVDEFLERLRDQKSPPPKSPPPKSPPPESP